jgi:hypothetical protein
MPAATKPASAIAVTAAPGLHPADEIITNSNARGYEPLPILRRTSTMPRIREASAMLCKSVIDEDLTDPDLLQDRTQPA